MVGVIDGDAVFDGVIDGVIVGDGLTERDGVTVG